MTDEAAVWPAAVEPTRVRYGYTVSHDVYAAATKVAGWKVTVVAGNASVYAGTPNGSHSGWRLPAGQSFTLPARGAGEVVSVQSGGDFQYTLTPGTPPTQEPTEEPTARLHRPDRLRSGLMGRQCMEVQRNGSHPGDWAGGVITWPSWSAFASNNRAGFDSRTVYSVSGQKLYPYMGEWADGCEIEVVSGGVLIIEWERGLDGWRETYLSAGDTYTINLVGSENGAMIETPNNVEPFEFRCRTARLRRSTRARPTDRRPARHGGPWVPPRGSSARRLTAGLTFVVFRSERWRPRPPRRSRSKRRRATRMRYRAGTAAAAACAVECP